MIEYTKIEIEDELKKEKDIELQKLDWPMNGAIEYVNATMRYREELPPSIKNLSFKVEAGMKIGIVGRTGSGKSSILQTLFRLVDLDEGYATIDGVRLTEPGLHQLRKHIAFIPQNPFLIQGTIRENLDPFDEISDKDIENIITEVNLTEKISKLPLGVNTYCSEANNLFSAGQKQLICLARAILRHAKILVLDEATANVDLETDNFIQRKLKERFSNCTVLIVAHRLATIIDSDRILVMSDGQSMEFNHPYYLMVNKLGDESITRPNGYFSKMVLETGPETALSLFEMAHDSFDSSNKKWPVPIDQREIEEILVETKEPTP